jgi:hypothetical protein
MPTLSEEDLGWWGVPGFLRKGVEQKESLANKRHIQNAMLTLAV